MITIHDDGRVEMLDGQFDLGGRQVAKRRASHVVPTGRLRRLLFRLCRIAGDDSELAAWTRTWDCNWTVDLRPSAGPVVSGFYNRDTAIEFEVDWISRNGIQEQQQCNH